MRSTTLSTLTLAAALLLGACADDGVTSPSTGGGPEYAKGNGGAPDRIVFARKGADGNFDIYTMRANGKGVQQLTSSTSWNTNPRWTPDHSKIVFTSVRTFNSRIYIMNADGSNQTELTHGYCQDVRPAPSPDGTRIVFARIGCQADSVGIFVVNIDGSNPTRLTSWGSDLDPSWSPDGSTINFASNRSGLGYDIWSMHADGSNQIPRQCGAPDCRGPMFSPDGTRLAFWSSLNGGSIMVYRPGYGTIPVVTNIGLGSNYAPAWSADGSKLVFTADFGDLDLYSVNSYDGSGLKAVNPLPGEDVSPSWHR